MVIIEKMGIEGLETYKKNDEKYNNTNINCNDFCKNMYSIPDNCSVFNDSKVQKCLNDNNALIQPKCAYVKKTCKNIA